MDQMWNKIKLLIDVIQEQDKEAQSSEYILLKDFNKLTFRLYKKNTEEEEEDEGDNEWFVWG